MENFKTISDLLLNIKSQGIKIEPSFETDLSYISYSSYITPYKDLVCCGKDDKNERIYPEDCSTDDFKKFLECDLFISNTLRIYISYFENSLKSFLIEEIGASLSSNNEVFNQESIENYINEKSTFSCFIPISKKYDNKGILVDLKIPRDINNNELTILENRTYQSKVKTIRSFVFSSKNSEDKKRANSYCSYFLTNGKDVPFWAAIHNMSLRDLCTLFDMLKYSNREKFFKLYCGYIPNDRHKSDFANRFFAICDIRNVVQHYEPIIPFILNFKSDRYQQLVAAISDLKIFCESNPFYERLIKDGFNTNFKENQYNKSKLFKLKQILQVLNNKKSDIAATLI